MNEKPLVSTGNKFEGRSGLVAEVVRVSYIGKGKRIVFAYDGCHCILPQSEFLRRFKPVDAQSKD